MVASPYGGGRRGPLSCLFIRLFDPFNQISIDHLFIFYFYPMRTHRIPAAGGDDIAVALLQAGMDLHRQATLVGIAQNSVHHVVLEIPADLDRAAPRRRVFQAK